MKYKTAFRLALRAIGIWLIVTGLPDLIGNVGFAIEFVGGPTAAPWAWWARLAGCCSGRPSGRPSAEQKLGRYRRPLEKK